MTIEQSIVKEAWQKVSGLKKPLWGGLLLFALFTGAGDAILHIGMNIAHYFYPTEKSATFLNYPRGLIVALGTVYVLYLIYNTLVLLPMRFGFLLIPLRHAAGKPTKASYVFKLFQWRHISQFIILEICTLALIGIPASISIGLFIAPDTFQFDLATRIMSYVTGAIILLVSFTFTVCILSARLAIVDRNISAWEALKLSCSAIKPRWAYVLKILMIAIFALLLGTLCLIIGLIWAIPFAQNLYILVYDRLVGIESKDPVSAAEQNIMASQEA